MTITADCGLCRSIADTEELLNCVVVSGGVMPYMSLVEPLLPTHIFELIYAGWRSESEDERQYGSAAMLERLARALHKDDVLADPHCDLARSCTRLEAQLMECESLCPSEQAVYRRDCLRKRLFAARLIESLWHLRVHNSNAARQSCNHAWAVYRQSRSAFEKAVALQSLGLVAALIAELEDKLARIRPCL